MISALVAGLSPRVRGNQHHRDDLRASGGSIPARAGESGLLVSMLFQSCVYPPPPPPACGGIGLVYHHEASDGNGLVYRHTAADHGLEGPGPPAQV